MHEHLQFWKTCIAFGPHLLRLDNLWSRHTSRDPWCTAICHWGPAMDTRTSPYRLLAPTYILQKKRIEVSILISLFQVVKVFGIEFPSFSQKGRCCWRGCVVSKVVRFAKSGSVMGANARKSKFGRRPGTCSHFHTQNKFSYLH